jgi:hypothetical protein
MYIRNTEWVTKARIAYFTYPHLIAGISIMYDAPPLACRQAIVLSSVLPIRKYRKFGD